jgi:hypothetical protein
MVKHKTDILVVLASIRTTKKHDFANFNALDYFG